MNAPEINVVTGAFSYTGKYITQLLLNSGKQVRALTRHPERNNPFGKQVDVFPYGFDNQEALVKSLQSATTLYNTYWIRFPYKGITFDHAIENSIALIRAAESAGVQKFVHISVTNASPESSLPYFKGKGFVEQSLINSSLSYAIIRPTLIFGKEDILINNIAWFLRKFPLFPIFGKGDYQIQPIYAEDVAELAIQAGQETENVILDAVGPEIYTYTELVTLIANKIHSSAKIIHLHPAFILLLSEIIGFFVQDTMITRDEIIGLMANLLVSNSPPMGQTRFSTWLAQNATILGTQYTSELNRHYR